MEAKDTKNKYTGIRARKRLNFKEMDTNYAEKTGLT
jgi:hypothetical protein